ncbi:6,7,8-trihydroxycoumarin synthase-like [Salvia miltiorrhiza]|uniref:6,7,8-trihydroxycoumarin synthase-like n=1 Tax=Salvia miltiorrhiza TaxID=226208 RepID=UPI0025AD3354|nr:6,7,8-trihydroxycoumarin synthase-like [Salvia miltiorrhiza]
MTPFLLLFALPIILILYFQTQNPKHAKEELPPPGPPQLPFIGNLHHFDGRSPHTYLHRLSKQYDAVTSLKLGFRRLVVISSAEAVKEIMKSHDAVFSSRPALVTFKKLPYKGHGIGFSPYNDAWRELRKISAIHLFSAKQVQSFRPIFRDELSKMMEKIARDAASSAATDLSETMMSFATNAISRAAFGRRFGDQGYEKTRFFDLFHGEKPLLGGFFVEDYLPWLRWIDSLSGMAAKLDKNISSLHSFCDELIEEHMNPNRPESMEGDVIDILLRIKRDGSSFHLTLDHIKGLLVVMLSYKFHISS